MDSSQAATYREDYDLAVRMQRGDEDATLAVADGSESEADNERFIRVVLKLFATFLITDNRQLRGPNETQTPSETRPQCSTHQTTG